MIERVAAFLLVSCLTGTAFAQAGGAAPAVASSLQPYLGCHFPDDLHVVEITPIRAEPMVRTVMTPQGSKHIVMLHGERIMFAYPFSDFFANVKVEELPAASFSEESASLLGELTSLTQSGEMVAASPPPQLSGFLVKGVDRPTLKGGVLGTYLLIDEANKVVTTIYFLNQDPGRNFHTLGEYQKLRDQFLNTYPGCVRLNQDIHTKP